MPRRPSRTPAVPTVPGIDLEFRPASYWDAPDPVSAIVQNIKGQQRRRMARDFLDSPVANALNDTLGPIDDGLLADRVGDADRIALGRIHPSFMGGEYLPDYGVGEVEIARVVLQSSTQDVYSLRARRSRPGGRIRYRLLDEYEGTYELTPASSTRSLSLRELIHLLDTVEGDIDTGGDGLVLCWAAQQLEHGDDPDDAIAFVSVESSVYPRLTRYYDARLRSWAAERRAELGEDHDG